MIDANRHDQMFLEGAHLIEKYAFAEDKADMAVEIEVLRDELTRGVELLGEVYDMNPDNFSAPYMIGKAHQVAQDWERAHTAFKLAYDVAKRVIDEDNPDLGVCIGNILRDLACACLFTNRFKDAVYYCTVASDMEPDDHTLVANYCVALLMAGQADEALKRLEESMSKHQHGYKSEVMLINIRDVVEGKKPQPTTFAEFEEMSRPYFEKHMKQQADESCEGA